MSRSSRCATPIDRGSTGGRPLLPDAALVTDLDDLLARDDLDAVDVLVPTPLHGVIGTRVLEARHHLHIQKPISRSMGECDELLKAADASGAMVRVLEDYVFFPPLVKLKEIVETGELGTPVGLHMKVVNTGRGGWDVLPSAYVWQLEQTKDGRGMLVFDHAWHQTRGRHLAVRPGEIDPGLGGPDRSSARFLPGCSGHVGLGARKRPPRHA